MKKTIKYLIILFFSLTVNCKENSNSNVIDSDYLTVGTFNIEWLGDGINDTKPRNEKEIQQIADIISSSGMEIIAVQEIENEVALARIVSKMDDYKLKISKNQGKQKTGIIYKNYITVEEIGEYKPLNLNGNLRSGYTVNVTKNDYNLLMMIVHLKSTSRYDSTEILKEESKITRYSQAEIISNWADSVLNQAKIKEFAIIGDFNDYPTRKNNPTLEPISNNENLHFLTSDIRSCKNPFWLSIDHIVVSEETQKRYVPNSVFVYDFNSMLNETEAEQISDHCPICVQLKIKFNL